MIRIMKIALAFILAFSMVVAFPTTSVFKCDTSSEITLQSDSADNVVFAMEDGKKKGKKKIKKWKWKWGKKKKKGSGS